MAIINAEIEFQILQAAGNYRVKYKYTLDDARVFYIGPVSVATLGEITMLMDSKKALLEDKIMYGDADDAIDQGIVVSYKTATLAQVQLRYLKLGFFEEDPLGSYKILNKVADDVIALGKTTAELAVYFNIPVAKVQAIVTRWQYLKANKVDILAYKDVMDGM